MDLDLLYSLVGSETRARLAAYFVANPEARRGADALARSTGLSRRALQAELAWMIGNGLVRRERQGRRVLYARTWVPEWRTLENLVSSHGIPLLLQSALAEVPGVEAAFIFGSLARGDARPDSDVDVLVYGDHLAGPDLGRAALDAAIALQRSVDLKEYDSERFRHDNNPNVSFLPTALAGPKVWLVGSATQLPGAERKAA
jgi:predicted nucleotidyltransferase